MASPTRLHALVRGAADLQRLALEAPGVTFRVAGRAHGRLVAWRQGPDALEEAVRALHLLVAPVEVALRRAGEEHVGAGGVRAVPLDDGRRSDHVPPALSNT